MIGNTVVIPAQAGIQFSEISNCGNQRLDADFHRHDAREN